MKKILTKENNFALVILKYIKKKWVSQKYSVISFSLGLVLWKVSINVPTTAS